MDGLDMIGWMEDEIPVDGSGLSGFFISMVIVSKFHPLRYIDLGLLWDLDPWTPLMAGNLWLLSQFGGCKSKSLKHPLGEHPPGVFSKNSWESPACGPTEGNQPPQDATWKNPEGNGPGRLSSKGNHCPFIYPLY